MQLSVTDSHEVPLCAGFGEKTQPCSLLSHGDRHRPRECGSLGGAGAETLCACVWVGDREAGEGWWGRERSSWAWRGQTLETFALCVATPRLKGFCFDLLSAFSGPDRAEEPGHGRLTELGAAFWMSDPSRVRLISQDLRSSSMKREWLSPGSRKTRGSGEMGM